jgi:hypothetical protein
MTSTCMGIVFVIFHQGMVIPIWLMLCLVMCSLEPIQGIGYGLDNPGFETRQGQGMFLCPGANQSRALWFSRWGKAPWVSNWPITFTQRQCPPICLHGVYRVFTVRYFSNPSPFRLTPEIWAATKTNKNKCCNRLQHLYSCKATLSPPFCDFANRTAVWAFEISSRPLLKLI